MVAKCTHRTIIINKSDVGLNKKKRIQAICTLYYRGFVFFD